jgi:hypothetical protein
MGLTIHWKLAYRGRNPRPLLEQIRQRALDLPFQAVGEMLHFKGKDCERQGEDDPRDWLKTQASEYVKDPQNPHCICCPVWPLELIGFEIAVARGSEPANLVLARHPKVIIRHLRRIPTRLSGWSSGGTFCKTQYATRYGIENFLRAHVAVITLLEWAAGLPGLKVYINDEGKYGSSRYTDHPEVAKPVYTDHPGKHDLTALAKEVGEWNEMIAAQVGALKDALGPQARNLEAEIFKHPDFERLEARGRKHMPSPKKEERR